MDWAALRSGFDDELDKIGEVNLAGLSAGTILNYPEPQPAPSEAFDKARSILMKAQKYQDLSPQDGEEKIAKVVALRSEQFPQAIQKKRRRDSEPPPGNVEKAKSIGGHMLAGAGATRFVHDWSEHVHKAKGGASFSPRHKALAVATGATLGLSEWARKQRRKKKWQEGKLKVSGGFNFPSTGRASAQFLGKSGPNIKQLTPRIGVRGSLPKV